MSDREHPKHPFAMDLVFGHGSHARLYLTIQPSTDEICKVQSALRAVLDSVMDERLLQANREDERCEHEWVKMGSWMGSPYGPCLDILKCTECGEFGVERRRDLETAENLPESQENRPKSLNGHARDFGEASARAMGAFKNTPPRRS